MNLSDFEFDLPDHLIAQQPLAQRSASRLLRVRPSAEAAISDHQFHELPTFLRSGDLLVINDSKVIAARFFGHKSSGGKVEVLIERILDSRRALAMVRASNSPPIGTSLVIDGEQTATVIARHDRLFELQFDCDVLDLLDRVGQMPLPPYITRTPDANDAQRYQTVFARALGSVAAPTAGLHFDQPLLSQLGQAGIDICRVTLHVGAGTFAPVRIDNIDQHKMHSERFEINEQAAEQINQARRDKRRIVAVGTTALRTLEGAIQAWGDIKAGSAETRLFVRPGFDFQLVDVLLTNFHLPKSTLLMLTSAFGGLETIRQAYRHAIANEYRFFSYGDAMLIERNID